MKYALALTALIALIGFVGSARAADPKPKPGHFVKVEDNVLTYKGGAKGTGEEHTVKIDDHTKITIDGAPGKITDIKAKEFIEITAVKDVATLIAASSTGPATKPSTAPAQAAAPMPVPAK
jgi:hypothetical protein